MTFPEGATLTTGSRVHAIFWIPPGYALTTSYVHLIDQYFNDLDVDSTGPDNVYSVLREYGEWFPFNDLPVADYAHVSYAGAIIDQTSFPPASQRCAGTQSVCLRSQAVADEVARVVNHEELPSDPQDVYFLFTPAGVQDCQPNGSCSSRDYCAYHAPLAGGDGPSFAYIPYSPWISTCGAGSIYGKQGPNRDDADAAVNLISHEHVGAITDPGHDGTGWVDSQGRELADKCAWVFGGGLGETSTFAPSYP
jgi:hypothetical protein